MAVFMRFECWLGLRIVKVCNRKSIFYVGVWFLPKFFFVGFLAVRCWCPEFIVFESVNENDLPFNAMQFLPQVIRSPDGDRRPAKRDSRVPNDICFHLDLIHLLFFFFFFPFPRAVKTLDRGWYHEYEQHMRVKMSAKIVVSYRMK